LPAPAYGAVLLPAPAAQDIATDGLAVRILETRERGLANGTKVGAYRIGTILGGGLLLWICARAVAKGAWP